MCDDDGLVNVVRAIDSGQGVSLDWSAEALAKAQADDPYLGPVYAAMRRSIDKPTWKSFLATSSHTKNNNSMGVFHTARRHFVSPL